MLQASQLRAARALLGWRQEDLAKASKSALATIARIEQSEGPVQGRFSTIMRIQDALQHAGIRFLDDDGEGFGVRLKKRQHRR